MSDTRRPEWGIVQLDRDLRVVALQLIDIAAELRAERRLSTSPTDRMTMEDNSAGAEDCARAARRAAETDDYWVMYDALARAMQEHVAARTILDSWRADRIRAERDYA